MTPRLPVTMVSEGSMKSFRLRLQCYTLESRSSGTGIASSALFDDDGACDRMPFFMG